MDKRPTPDLTPPPKTNHEVLGAILGAVAGSVLGASTGQMAIALLACIGLGWLFGLLLEQRRKARQENA